MSNGKVEFYHSLEKAVDNLALNEENQNRLVPDLTKLIKVKKKWLSSNVRKIVQFISETNSHDINMPLLHDALIESGCGDDLLLHLISTRTRWAFRVLEQLIN